MLARMCPPDKVTEFFGFFSFSGKITAFAAPLAIGAVTVAWDAAAKMMAEIAVAMQGQDARPAMLLIAGLVIVILLAYWCTFQVNFHEVAVKTRLGRQVALIDQPGPGFRWSQCREHSIRMQAHSARFPLPQPARILCQRNIGSIGHLLPSIFHAGGRDPRVRTAGLHSLRASVSTLVWDTAPTPPLPRTRPGIICMWPGLNSGAPAETGCWQRSFARVQTGAVLLPRPSDWIPPVRTASVVEGSPR